MPLQGRYCRLEPLSAAKHARDIYEAQSEDTDGARWTYLFHGPYDNFADYEKWALGAEGSRDPQFYAIVDARERPRASGTCTYMRIEPKHGVIEIGNIYFSPRLARTRAATEAMYLLMANAFALGYRRYEWKCDSCNLPSRAAATRFGFTYEGLFRQAIVNKGRNRDTTWFAIIDRDWNGGLKDAYLRWLDPRQLRRGRRAEAAGCRSSRRRSCTRGAERPRKSPRACRRALPPARLRLIRFERSRVDARARVV